jgi:hypothetical protein
MSGRESISEIESRRDFCEVRQFWPHASTEGRANSFVTIDERLSPNVVIMPDREPAFPFEMINTEDEIVVESG